MASFYRQQLEDVLGAIQISADLVYDVGGRQLPVKDRVESWDVKEYKILDLPQWDIEKKNSEFALLPRADVTFCLETIEYCINPIYVFNNLGVITKPEGRIYISVPLIYPTHNDIKYDSLRLTERGIQRLAEHIGRRVTNTWYRRDKSGLLKSFYAADGMRAAKEYPNHDVTGFIVELQK